MRDIFNEINRMYFLKISKRVTPYLYNMAIGLQQQPLCFLSNSFPLLTFYDPVYADFPNFNHIEKHETLFDYFISLRNLGQ